MNVLNGFGCSLAKDRDYRFERVPKIDLPRTRP